MPDADDAKEFFMCFIIIFLLLYFEFVSYFIYIGFFSCTLFFLLFRF